MKDNLARLILAQGNHCAGCGKPMLPRADEPPRKGDAKYRDLPSIDHTVPRVRGGKNGAGNIVAMHILCNKMKGDDMPTGCELIWLEAVNCRMGWR